MSTFYVRLKPHAPHRGFVVRTYVYRGAMFYTGKWYKLADAQMAKELSRLHQRFHDDLSPMLFDVTSEAGAKELERREREQTQSGVGRAQNVAARHMMAGAGGAKPGRAQRGRPAKVSVPTDLTVADLRAPSKKDAPVPAAEFEDDEPELTEEEILDGFEAGERPMLDGADVITDDEESSTDVEEIGKLELDEDVVHDAPAAEEIAPTPKAAKAQAKVPAKAQAKAQAKGKAPAPSHPAGRTRGRR
jgi:hypothetical protein